MGVQIASVLATVWSNLTIMSGVKLKTHPDPETQPEDYVHEVILQWCMGHSLRPPSWKELLQVIQDIGLEDLKQQIEAFMKGKALISVTELTTHYVYYVY